MDLEPLKIDRTGVKRRRRSFPWGKLLFLALLGGAGWLFRKPLIELYEGVTLPTVEVARVIRRRPSTAGAVRGAAANGYIVARTRAALSADTPGRVVELTVEEGSVVAEGDLVARLFDEEFKAAVDRAEADLRFSEASYKKSESQRDSVESALLRLRSEESAAVARLDEAKALALLAVQNLERFEKLVAEGVERQQLLDEARQDHDSRAARVVTEEANVQSARAAVVEGESRLEVERAAVEEAAAQVEVMRATRNQAQATLDKTEVRAPFAGVVVLKDAEIGEVVSPNSQGGNSRGSVVTMVDFRSLEVQADVPETSLSAVREGAPARIFLDAFPEDPYEGVVQRIWPTADRQKATVEVRIGFAELDERLRPEMGVRVVFVEEGVEEERNDQETIEVLQIPADAVTRIDGASCVFVVERDVVSLREVEVSEARSGRVRVDEGLSEGETVVLSPPADLKDGQRVLLGSNR